LNGAIENNLSITIKSLGKGSVLVKYPYQSFLGNLKKVSKKDL